MDHVDCSNQKNNSSITKNYIYGNNSVSTGKSDLGHGSDNESVSKSSNTNNLNGRGSENNRNTRIRNGNHTNQDPSSSESSSTTDIETLNLNKEVDRLKTFSSFPNLDIDTSLLALIGFYYTGITDKVRCHFCNCIYYNIRQEDNPVKAHTRYSSSCPLMRRRETDNVPIDPQRLDEVLPPLVYDVCGHNSTNEEKIDDKYPHFKLEAERLGTYKEWPRALSQQPEELAEAGFFYTGRGDKVVCFSCGLGLKEWEQQDTAWEEHAKWSPKCTFLIFMRGEKYIEEIQMKIQMKISEVKVHEEEIAKKDAQSNISEEKPEIPLEKCCKVCYVAPIQVAFTPCGHAATCRKCAFSLEKCPICRSDIKDKVLLHFA